MRYTGIEQRLRDGGVVILDGGTGTELERRGIPMDPNAWCGPASLENAGVLEAIHRDYIAAGADIITANTYASSRLMLRAAGCADRFEEINRTAVDAAHRARRLSGRDDVLVAGSVSHMRPVAAGTGRSDPAKSPSPAEMADAFAELALLLRDAGCDLILLEMMYDPARIRLAFAAAMASGLPVWAGFSARRGEDGALLSYLPETETPFAGLLDVLDDYDVAAAGVMHTPADVTADALAMVRRRFGGPLLAYPDSGYFEMPHWRFHDVIPPQTFARFAAAWVDAGTQIIGGCCGLSPDHIAAVAPLKGQDGSSITSP